MKSTKIVIGDAKWDVYLVTEEEFSEIHGADHNHAAALTDTEKKHIFYKIEHVTRHIIRHELFHAYFTQALVYNIDITKDGMEEVCADVYGKYGEEMYKNSKKLEKWVKRHLGI